MPSWHKDWTKNNDVFPLCPSFRTPGYRRPCGFILLLALAAYGLVLERLGFLIVTFGLLVFLLKIVVPQRWPRVLISAALSTLISYLLFEVWLKAQLPRGFIGI